MNDERLILKGRLGELRQQKISLSLQINNRINAIKRALAASSISSIAGLDLAAVHDLAKEADLMKVKYLEVCADMEAIERELE